MFTQSFEQANYVILPTGHLVGRLRFKFAPYFFSSPYFVSELFAQIFERMCMYGPYANNPELLSFTNLNRFNFDFNQHPDGSDGGLADFIQEAEFTVNSIRIILEQYQLISNVGEFNFVLKEFRGDDVVLRKLED